MPNVFSAPTWRCIEDSTGAATFGICVRRVLAEGVRWARLETRTKESNMYASRWVENPRGAGKPIDGMDYILHHRPTMIFCERFE